MTQEHTAETIRDLLERGFRSDADEMRRAKIRACRYLSPRQLALARYRMSKYAKQLLAVARERRNG